MKNQTVYERLQTWFWLDRQTHFRAYSLIKRSKINIALALVDIFIHEYMHETNPNANGETDNEKDRAKITQIKKKRVERSRQIYSGRI